MKMLLANGSEIQLIHDGCTENRQGNQLSCIVAADDYTVAELESMLTEQNLAEITLLSDDGEKEHSNFVGFTNVTVIQKNKDYLHKTTDGKYVRSTVIIFRLTQKAAVYATQEDIDILADAVAELAELIGGEA